MRVVIVGAGTAGGRLAAELVAGDPGVDITLIGDEPHPPYWRALLTSVLAGDTRAGDTAIHPRDWYRRNNVRLLVGQPVRAIDRVARHVVTDGATVPYDRLVLATGSVAAVPRLGGLPHPRAVPLRTRGDCGRLLRVAASAQSAVVLGGGLLGVEAARALRRSLPDVTIVHSGPHLLSSRVPAGAGQVLERSLARLGVGVRTGARATSLRRRHGRLRLALEGEALPCDLLVLACGSQPATSLGTAAGLPARDGIVVGDDLRCAEDIWAVGACAEHRGTVDDTAPCAEEQAEVAARVILGGRAATAAPARCTACGRATWNWRCSAIPPGPGGTDEGDGGAADVLEVRDPVRGVFTRVAVRDGRVAGGVLLGDVGAVGTLVPAYDRGLPVPPGWRSLLLPGNRKVTSSNSVVTADA